MGVPTAFLMLLSGDVASVPVDLNSFQQPPGTGGISGSFLVAEHVASLNAVPSISLPELSRRITATSLWYDFSSRALKGLSPVDGGYPLRRGLTDQVARPVGDDGANFLLDLRFSDDDLGHILPFEPGTQVRIELMSFDGVNVAWSGDVAVSSRSSEALPPSLSLKELRAIVEVDRGSVRVVVPDSSTSMGLSLLGVFMTIFYLFVVLQTLHTIDFVTTRPSDLPSSLKLFIMNGPTNAAATAISGLIVSGSAIQTFRETVSLLYALIAAGFVAFGLWRKSDSPWIRMPTVRVTVESCLLTAIALPMGVFSRLAQFSGLLLGIGITVIALMNFPRPGGDEWWRPGTFPHRSTVVDLAFRLGAILLLAPVILFPVSLTSSIEYTGAVFLIYPSIVLTAMSGAAIAHTWLDTPPRKLLDVDASVVESVLFVALTILLKTEFIAPRGA